MAIGDDAVAAGMDLVDPSDDMRNGWEEDNRTRDYIVQQGRLGVHVENGDAHQVYVKWDGGQFRLMLRVDDTDLGALAYTSDTGGLANAITQQTQQYLSLLARVQALESKVN